MRDRGYGQARCQSTRYSLIRAYDAADVLVAETNERGDPLRIPPGSRLVVETGLRIEGTNAS